MSLCSDEYVNMESLHFVCAVPLYRSDHKPFTRVPNMPIMSKKSAAMIAFQAQHCSLHWRSDIDGSIGSSLICNTLR